RARLLAARSDPLEVLAECDLKYREEGAEKGGGALGPPAPLAELEKRAQAERSSREKAARDAYDEALKLAPRLVPALVGRARLALARGDAKAARPDLEAAEASLAERPWTQVASQGGDARDQ